LATDGVGPEFTLAFGAVQIEHHRVDLFLIQDAFADDRRGDDLIDVLNRKQDAFALIPFFIVVPQLQCLMGPRGSARWNRRPLEDAAFGFDIDFHRGIPPGIKYLSSLYRSYVHRRSLKKRIIPCRPVFF
jgi:hypothetical protein